MPIFQPGFWLIPWLWNAHQYQALKSNWVFSYNMFAFCGNWSVACMNSCIWLALCLLLIKSVIILIHFSRDMYCICWCWGFYRCLLDVKAAFEVLGVPWELLMNFGWCHPHCPPMFDSLGGPISKETFTHHSRLPKKNVAGGLRPAMNFCNARKGIMGYWALALADPPCSFTTRPTSLL